MEDAASRELFAVLLMTAVLLVFGLIAVALFIRQYRRERKDREDRES